MKEKMLESHPLFQSALTSFADFQLFEQKICQLAEAMQLHLSDYEIDHLALRVNTEENARNWLELLMKCGTILSNNLVNGRPIYLIELNQPLLLAGKPVQIIELPFPKNKTYPFESWEHIEIVMPFESGESTENWLSRLEKQFLWKQSTTFNVKVSEPQVEGERLSNPTIAVTFAQPTDNLVCIKVHPYNIKTIIKD